MKKDTNDTIISLNKKQFDSLVSTFPILTSIEQRLDGIIAPEIIKQIKKVYEIIGHICEEELTRQDQLADDNYSKFEDIAEQNNFSTVWSIEDISPADINSPYPHKIKKITYETWGKNVEVDIVKTDLTWLDIWKLCDDLIARSGDSHHIFIEGLIKESKKKGVFSLSTGS